MNEIRNRMLDCGSDSTVVVAVDQLAEAGLQLIQAQATTKVDIGIRLDCPAHHRCSPLRIDENVG